MEFCPRFIVTNETDLAVTMRQRDTHNQLAIPASKSATWNQWALNTDNLVCIKFEGWKESAPFGITDLGEVKVKMPKENSDEQLMASIEVKADYATTMVTINKVDMSKQPYRIENKSRAEIRFRQKVQ